MHSTNIYELPDSIFYLSSLHYLDISETPIRFLPESIGSLRHLQSLKLKDCFNISRLPNCTRKVIILRHLHIHIVGQLISMSPAMDNLTSLQTLKDLLLKKKSNAMVRESSSISLMFLGHFVFQELRTYRVLKRL